MLHNQANHPSIYLYLPLSTSIYLVPAASNLGSSVNYCKSTGVLPANHCLSLRSCDNTGISPLNGQNSRIHQEIMYDLISFSPASIIGNELMYNRSIFQMHTPNDSPAAPNLGSSVNYCKSTGVLPANHCLSLRSCDNTGISPLNGQNSRIHQEIMYYRISFSPASIIGNELMYDRSIFQMHTPNDSPTVPSYPPLPEHQSSKKAAPRETSAGPPFSLHPNFKILFIFKPLLIPRSYWLQALSHFIRNWIRQAGFGKALQPQAAAVAFAAGFRFAIVTGRREMVRHVHPPIPSATMPPLVR